MSNKMGKGKKAAITTVAVLVAMVACGNIIGDTGAPDPSPAVTATATPTVGTAEPTGAAPATVEPSKAEEVDVPREYKSALAKAEFYAEGMNKSKAAIREQLTSEYGEGFSKPAADYAVNTLETDYNAHALQKARFYRDKMSMSRSAIREQLVSAHGEQFTAAEADYAMSKLEE